MSTQEKTDGFFLPSKEEQEKEQQGGAPLEADDYIVKIAAIDLKKAPTFVNNRPNWSELTLSYKTICLPVALKAGGTMKDTEGKEAKKLSRWIFRDINPFSTGFQPDKVSPSFLRGFVSYMENVPVQDRIKTPDFILINKNKEVVTDEAIRNQFLHEMGNADEPKKLMGEGYQALPDIRSYVGKYIGCAVELDNKGGNKISKFSKLPENFVPPTADEELEAMNIFQESYKKMTEKLDKRDADQIANAGGAPVAVDTPVTPDASIAQENIEVNIDDVAF